MLSLFELSFYFAYFFLAGSTALTAFEVFNTFPSKYEPLKYILAIETTVNIIASVAYSSLITLVKQQNFSNITSYRYLDWFATTPLLLISLTLYLQYKKSINTNTAPNAPTTIPTTIPTTTQNIIQNAQVKFEYDRLGIIVGLNVLMLIFGYLGETGKMNHILACVLGFIPFIVMFYLIWEWYGDSIKNKKIFIIFIVVWALYGIVYFLPNIPKNISYNILDVIAKVGFGLLIWFEVVQLRLTDEIDK
jgi:bacteriorhodopsin